MLGILHYFIPNDIFKIFPILNMLSEDIFSYGYLAIYFVMLIYAPDMIYTPVLKFIYKIYYIIYFIFFYIIFYIIYFFLYFIILNNLKNLKTMYLVHTLIHI